MAEQNNEYTEFLMQHEPATLEEAKRVVAGLKAMVEQLREKDRRDRLIPTMLHKVAMEQHVEMSVGEGKPLGLLLVDINNFKKVNDTLGHRTGDALLVEFGQLVDETFKRSTDKMIGRIGGDEFLVTVDLSGEERRESSPHMQMDNTYELLKEVERRLIENNTQAGALGMGLAIGGALFDPGHPVSARTLLEQADEAMYEEKGEGRR